MHLEWQLYHLVRSCDVAKTSLSMMLTSSVERQNLREERVQDTLTSKKWEVGGKLLFDWSWSSYRPILKHSMFSLLTLEFSFEDDVVDVV